MIYIYIYIHIYIYIYVCYACNIYIYTHTYTHTYTHIVYVSSDADVVRTGMRMYGHACEICFCDVAVALGIVFVMLLSRLSLFSLCSSPCR